VKRKLENIFSRVDGYNCIACGPKHPFGLRLEFFYDEDTRTVSSQMTPGDLFSGFPGILHGGIQATILDEIAFWGVWAQHGQSGFTYDFNIQYRKKCPPDVLLEALGEVGDVQRRLVSVNVQLRNQQNKDTYSKGTVRYFIPSTDLIC
jgi:acyl-coenzyme A thioesterase PaaI-like protein